MKKKLRYTREEAKERRLFNMFRRYRKKNQYALDNYLKRDSKNEHWYTTAGKWAAKARKQFPWFCG